MAKITLDSSEYESGLNEASESTSSVGNTLKDGLTTAAKVGAAAIATATTAVVGFSAASVSVGSEFDSSMSQVAATMGTTTDQITELRDFALEMGSSTSFSATQASEALNYMALAGYDASTSMEMLPTVLNLAAAGGMELATASDMVTDAQSALGLSLEETSTMVDQMAMASSKSNTSVEQLGEAILSIGGTAQDMAGGTTELSTALGILADNGIKGAEGGTHLRNIILALEAPTDTAAAAMESLGLEVFDAEGNMRPMNDILNDLNDSMADMTSAEKTNMISTIFNKTDIASVNALLSNSGERWDELSGYIDEAAGSAEEMANTQLDNLAGDITLFESALEGAQIAISDQLTPTLREFVQFGSDAVSELSAAFQEGGLSGAMDALGTILSEGLAMVIEQVPEMISAGMQLLEALGQGLLDNLPLITDAALEVVTMLVEGVASELPQIVKAGIEVITTLAGGLSDTIPELIPVAVEAIVQVVETLIDNVDQLIDAAIAIITALAEGLINSLPTLIEKAPEIVAKLVTAVIDNAPKLLEAAVQLVTSLANGLISNIPTLIKAVPQMVTSIKNAFTSKVSEFLSIGKNIVNGIWQGISNMASEFKSKVSNFFSGIVNSVKSVLGIASPSKVFAEIGGYMAEGLGEGWDDEYNSVKSNIEDGLDFGTATINYASSALGTTTNSIGASLTGAVSAATGDIKIVVQSVLDGKVIGESAYQYSKNKQRAYGVT